MRYELLGNNEDGEQSLPFSLVLESRDPNSSDDISLDYNVGSRWVNRSSNKTFELVDETFAAAVWTQTNSGGTALALGDLTDVTLVSVSRNDMLRYDDSTSQWTNQPRYNSQYIIGSIADLLDKSTDLGFFASTNSNHLQLETGYIYTIDAFLDITGYTLVYGAKTQINGLGQNVSGVRSSTSGTASNPYIMFKSTTNQFSDKLEILCEGTNQCVWDSRGDGTVTEGESFELNQFNVLCFQPPGHNNRLGYIKDIRQGFIGTFSAIGFENGFECAGAWTGGFRVEDTILINCSGVFFGSDPTDPVTFARRMASEANITVPSGSIGYDFPPTSFSSTGQYQLQGGNASGDGTYVTDWYGKSPAFDKNANFKNNTGIQNTFQGGEWSNNADNTTTITTANVWEDLVVTTDSKFLTWFTEVNGVFTYEGGNPLDIRIDLFPSLTGKANDIVQVRIIKEDTLAVITELKRSQITIQGTTAQGRAENVAIATTDQLVEGDKIRFQVRNTSGTTNISCLLDSNSIIQAK